MHDIFILRRLNGFLKSANFFSKLVWSKIRKVGIPLTVIFNVTNHCNSQCRHCYVTYTGRNSSSEMTTEEAKRVIADLRKNGCQRISFSGGEPLLREDIIELIDFVNSLGMYSTLNSNGILVVQQLRGLKKLDSLVISLDGRPQHHDAFRGEGTGIKALEAVIKAREAGIRVYTNTVIHKTNLNDIDYMLDLASRYRFKAEFSLVISNIFGNGILPNEFKPTDEEFREAIRHIIEKKRKRAPILFSAAAYESVLEYWKDFSIEGLMDTPSLRGIPRCPAGSLFCIIDAKGMLWACPHLMGKIEAKSALESGVSEAWSIASRHSCSGCYQIYHHEFGLLMDLSPSVVWNYIKTTMGLN